MNSSHHRLLILAWLLLLLAAASPAAAAARVLLDTTESGYDSTGHPTDSPGFVATGSSDTSSSLGTQKETGPAKHGLEWYMILVYVLIVVVIVSVITCTVFLVCKGLCCHSSHSKPKPRSSDMQPCANGCYKVLGGERLLIPARPDSSLCEECYKRNLERINEQLEMDKRRAEAECSMYRSQANR